MQDTLFFGTLSALSQKYLSSEIHILGLIQMAWEPLQSILGPSGPSGPIYSDMKQPLVLSFVYDIHCSITWMIQGCCGFIIKRPFGHFRLGALITTNVLFRESHRIGTPRSDAQCYRKVIQRHFGMEIVLKVCFLSFREICCSMSFSFQTAKSFQFFLIIGIIQNLY